MRKSGCVLGATPTARPHFRATSPLTRWAEASPEDDRRKNRVRAVRTSATAFGLAFLLAGCQTPATRTVVKEVQIPVAVQPIKPAQVPTPPAPLGPRPPSLSAAADTLLSKVCELEGYVLRADPLLRLSAGMEQKPLPPFKECEGH